MKICQQGTLGRVFYVDLNDKRPLTGDAEQSLQKCLDILSDTSANKGHGVVPSVWGSRYGTSVHSLTKDQDKIRQQVLEDNISDVTGDQYTPSTEAFCDMRTVGVCHECFFVHDGKCNPDGSASWLTGSSVLSSLESTADLSSIASPGPTDPSLDTTPRKRRQCSVTQSNATRKISNDIEYSYSEATGIYLRASRKRQRVHDNALCLPWGDDDSDEDEDEDDDDDDDEDENEDENGDFDITVEPHSPITPRKKKRCYARSIMQAFQE
ncbi:hypothetical protein GMORB2_3206 [Geosmithia morbida]|uniref:Uncharacterized protein n=1 Tax=Geosmithia morbida TaxID=1094350 RepID=A0A9P4YPL8_9HYPO|nr:uncharacterized protein GMORB2_3206 [Geosmithia morbida]KAF4120405.1 hypothetical protein GMORB2_3206 [Geosmithia morbida]